MRAPDQHHFPPTRFAALRRALAADPERYARTRNFLDGAVTALSPYLVHGYLDEAELFALWRARHGLTLDDRLGSELAWRCFFRQVRQHAGEAIFSDLRPGLPVAYAAALPADLVEARTGVPVIDASVRRLYETGYLHNHQRLWLASYAVHLRKAHWRAGADWLHGHLLDGDPASNHLSWQWVAGTFSHKPYLFNAQNVARYASSLASPGTAIDRDYAALDTIARASVDVGAEPGIRAGMPSPPCHALPPGHCNPALPASAGRTVALVHPWALGRRPPGEFVLGVVHAPAHLALPWSARRWDFVLAGMRACCDAIWVGDLGDIAPALRRAARLVAAATPMPGYLDAFGDALAIREPDRALPAVAPPVASFSAYLRQLRRLEPVLFRQPAAHATR